jgi:hypothetical protein
MCVCVCVGVRRAGLRCKTKLKQRRSAAAPCLPTADRGVSNRKTQQRWGGGVSWRPAVRRRATRSRAPNAHHEKSTQRRFAS